jgi:hypothetical protein
MASVMEYRKFEEKKPKKCLRVFISAYRLLPVGVFLAPLHNPG